MTSHLSNDDLMTLIDGGLTAEQLRLVARILSQPTPRSRNAERQARFRERQRNAQKTVQKTVTGPVTHGVTDNVTKPAPSPLGPPSSPHTPYHPPIIPPTLTDGDDDGRDALGWPIRRTAWVDALIAETGCADPARDTWPRLTAAVVLGWHEIDRFEWRDVTAGIGRVMAKAPDPPSSWRYFAKAIARARHDRSQPTPEPTHAPAYRASANESGPRDRPSRSTAYLVAAVERAQQRRDG